MPKGDGKKPPVAPRQQRRLGVDPGDIISNTSKHRANGHVEWSMLQSRATRPFFITGPPEYATGSSNNADLPKRHFGAYDMQRTCGRPGPGAEDTRDYNPKTHTEIHPRCAVDIGRSVGRSPPGARSSSRTSNKPSSLKADSAVAAGGALEGSLGAHEEPRMASWETPHGRFLRAPRSREPQEVEASLARRRLLNATPEQRAAAKALEARREEVAPLPTISAFDQLPPVAQPDHTLSVHKQPPAFTFAKHNEREAPPPRDRPELHPNLDLVRPRRPVRRFDRGIARGERPKLSDRYRDLFRTPPPAPLAAPDRPRSFAGYTPQQPRGASDVECLLAMADADLRRARSITQHSFGGDSRSAVRSSYIYPSSHAATPEPGATDMSFTAAAASDASSPAGM